MIYRQKTTLFNRFIRYFAILLLIPVLTGGIISYYTQYSASRKNAIMVYSDVNSRTNMSLEYMFQTIENAANEVAFNSSLQRALEDNKLTGENLPLSKSVEIKDILIDSAIKSNLLVKNTIVFSADGKYFANIGFYNQFFSIKDYVFFNSVSESHGENIWIPSHIDSNDPMTGSQHVITLVKRILRNSGENMGTTIGYLLINVKEKDLNKLLYTYDNQLEELILVDSTSGIVSYHDERMIATTFDISEIAGHSQGHYFSEFNGKPSFITYSKQEKTGWYLMGIVDSAEIFKESRYYLSVVILMAVVQLFIFIAISIILSGRISRPIVKLDQLMKKVENGNFNISFTKESGILEIDDLTRGFNEMVSKLNNLVHEVYNAELKKKQLEVEVKQAELEALQQQINPHFLYNTLDCINWMASLEGNDGVSKMVTALGNYFRSTIHRGRNFVSVEEEVNNIKEYIYIQSIRCGLKIKVDINCQQETSTFLTMKLMLQPLVENAIIHGLEPKHNSGMIMIDISKVKDEIIFIVEDDGVGMTPETLEKIINNSNVKDKRSIGVQNVLERLKLYFDEKHKFKIESAVGKGTRITIIIPCIYSEEQLNDKASL